MRELQALENAGRDEYQGIYFKEKKIGYVQSIYKPKDDQSLTIQQKGYMVLNILETIHPINLELNATLDKRSRLKHFSLSFKSPFYRMQAKGYVDNKQVHFTLHTNNNIIHDSIQLSEAPMLSTTRRGYLLRENMSIGDKIKVPWFDPISLTGKDSVVEYRGKEKILINKRIFNLHHFVEKFNGARVSIWLDERGRVIKEESPAGFVFIKEPEFKATHLDKSPSEILSAVSVELTGEMVPLKNRQFMRYRLTFPEQGDFDINDGRQSLSGNIVTIQKEQITHEKTQTEISCQDSDTTLHPTPYIQVDHPDITQTRQLIIGDTTNQLEKVKLLATWVFNTIDKRPVVGLPDALTTLKNRVGDCNEHAALFAALARNSGIPTRFVAGVTYNRKSFYYHAWNEVCIAGKWISLDTTVNQFPADLTHIKFITGGIKEQMRIGSLLGQLAIEILPDSQ